MGDSWEDEDFEVPILAPTTVEVKKIDEDEDLTLLEAKQASSAPKQPSAADLKREQERVVAAENKLKFSLQANETAEQRRIREKKQLEESESQLAGELFNNDPQGEKKSSSSLGGLASMPLKTKSDHTTFGNVIQQRLGDSSAFNVSAFYKSLSKVLDRPVITLEVLDEIIQDIQAIRDIKAKEVKKSTAKAGPPKKSKKEIEKEQKKHAAIFGGEYNDDDEYGNLEDGFM